MQASVEEKLRLLLRRLNFTPEDAALLTGMLRKMVWKLQHRQE
jgi:tRNA C32,U32 (ribose-2'-O)-methylase TrmJ